ncbi:MAG TPA: hypothetical protein VMV18_09020 [bacterium]|nr:hypothetical protein [bacterium]
MRGLKAFVFLAAAFAPSVALARPWHGATPGVTTKSEVVKKFGSPSRELPMSPRYASGMVYQAKEANEFGAEEAQFFFDAQGKLTEIFVFPQVSLKRDDVIKAYGTNYDERRTDDFRLYFQFKADGFVVFFDKDNDTVFQLQYTPAAAPITEKVSTQAPTPPPAPAATPAPAPAPAPVNAPKTANNAPPPPAPKQ